MYDEDTGEDVLCPYCSSADVCKHLAAFIDITFGEVLGGAFYERHKAFMEAIERAFLAEIKRGTRKLAGVTGGGADSDLTDLWSMAVEGYAEGDTFLSSDDAVLTRLQVDLFREADCEEPEGSPVIDSAPGQSSAFAVFYASEPSKAVENVFALLEGRLQALFTGSCART